MSKKKDSTGKNVDALTEEVAGIKEVIEELRFELSETRDEVQELKEQILKLGAAGERTVNRTKSQGNVHVKAHFPVISYGLQFVHRVGG